MLRKLLAMMLLLSLCIVIYIPVPSPRERRKVPFEWEMMPFHGEEYHLNMTDLNTTRFEYLLAGEQLTWTPETVEGIQSIIDVRRQEIYYGVCCYFLSVKVGDEWLIAGWVEYSWGERGYYIKYQSYYHDFTQIFATEIPENGDEVWVEIFLLSGNQWHALMILNAKVILEATVQFFEYPHEFSAYGKSLSRYNQLDTKFDWLMWHCQSSSQCLWGSDELTGIPSAVTVRQDPPYRIVVHKTSWCFTVNGKSGFGRCASIRLMRKFWMDIR